MGFGRVATPPAAAAMQAEVEAPRCAHETLDFEWHDPARGRDVPARLYLPQADAAVPLVVFSHGLGGSRFGFSNLGRHWAGECVAALHLQHAGSDRALWRAGRGWALLSSLREAATADNAVARAVDVRFALDHVLLEPSLAGRIDANRIGAAGHSFGANTALMVAGARFERDGKAMDWRDPRIKAAVILSPPSLPGGLDAQATYGAIAVPTLHLTGTRDVTPIPGLLTMPWHRREAFDAIHAAPRYLGIFDGGTHNAFSDWKRDATGLAVKAVTRKLTAAFWEANLGKRIDLPSVALLHAADGLPGADGAPALWLWERRD